MRQMRTTGSVDTLARDMVTEVGRWPAIGYMLGRLIGAETWPRARQAARLLIAIVRSA